MKFKERDQLVKDLREVADFIETHGLELPEFDVTLKAAVYKYNKQWQLDSEATKAAMAKAARGMAPCTKKYDTYSMSLVRNFGSVRMSARTSRESVCRKVVTGTKEVDKYEVVGKETVETYEWICDEPILAAN